MKSRARRKFEHIFEYPEMLDAKIKTKLNNSWKAHKSTMKKKGFDKNRSFEENLAHRPKDVLESQWAPLVTMWQQMESSSKAVQLQSENDNLRQDLAMAADRILGLETDIAMLKNILISRDLLPPNPNNEGYEDLMVDMQGS